MANAVGQNCQNYSYDSMANIEDNPAQRRGLDDGFVPPTLIPLYGLERRDDNADNWPMCTTTGHTLVNFYPPYWNTQAEPGTGDHYLAVSLDFERPPMNPILCDILQAALPIISAVVPEMEIAGAILEGVVDLSCAASQYQ